MNDASIPSNDLITVPNTNPIRSSLEKNAITSTHVEILYFDDIVSL